MFNKILLLLLSTFLFAASPARAGLLFEMKTGPETTRDGALNFFTLSEKEYFEQDLISSLSAGFIAGNIFGMSLEGTARSPEYIDNRFHGTAFEKAYVNVFLELFILRIGAGADISSFSTLSTDLQVFAGIVVKLSRKFALVAQATGYGTYFYPADAAFGNNVTLQVGISLRSEKEKKKKLMPWEDTGNPEWKAFWENRANNAMGTEQPSKENPPKDYVY